MGTTARLAPVALVGVLATSAVVTAMERLHYQEYPELEGLTVERVIVLGNNRTQEIVVRREMRLSEGSEFTSELLWWDWERVYDIGIFANVEVDAVSSGTGVLVVVSLYERPRWFAAPLLDYKIDTGEIRYGYTLRMRNMNGLNQTFNHRATGGEKIRVSLGFNTPWIGDRRQQVGISANFEYPQENKDDLLSNRLNVGTTNFIGDYRIVRQGVTYFGGIERLTRTETDFQESVDQLSPSVGIRWFRDTRNVRIDPTRGTLTQLGIEYAAGLRDQNLEYVRPAADLRGFQRFGWLTLAGRASTILTKGKIPDYRRFGIGGSGSIRGRPSDVDQGNSIALVSAEVRFPMLPMKRFTIPIPGLPRDIANFDLRVDGALFVDAGTAWEDRTDVGNTSVKTGAGFGLRIFLPVLELARIEVAFDEEGHATFYFTEGNAI